VLADNEGYTTQIRTSEWKSGLRRPACNLTTAAPASRRNSRSSTGLQRMPINGIVRTLGPPAPGLRPFTQPRPQSGIRPPPTASPSKSPCKNAGTSFQRRISTASGSQNLRASSRARHTRRTDPESARNRTRNPAKLARRSQSLSLCHSDSIARSSAHAIVLRSRSGRACFPGPTRVTSLNDGLGYKPIGFRCSTPVALESRQTTLQPAKKPKVSFWFATAILTLMNFPAHFPSATYVLLPFPRIKNKLPPRQTKAARVPTRAFVLSFLCSIVSTLGGPTRPQFLRGVLPSTIPKFVGPGSPCPPTCNQPNLVLLRTSDKDVRMISTYAAQNYTRRFRFGFSLHSARHSPAFRPIATRT